MEDGPTTPAPAGTNGANLALYLGIAAAVVWIIAIVVNGDDDQYGWLWPIMAVLGLAAVVTGLRSRENGKLAGRALAGTVIGGLLVALFVAFIVGDIVS